MTPEVLQNLLTKLEITMKKTQNINRHLRLALSIICIGAMPLTVGLLASGCAGDRYHESTGENIDDTSTTARVKKALHNDTQYKYENVKVSTFKGTVQLSGFADSRDAKSRAGEIAKMVEGVKDLENNITVK
jgi:hyperosmotically inducible protein